MSDQSKYRYFSWEALERLCLEKDAEIKKRDVGDAVSSFAISCQGDANERLKKSVSQTNELVIQLNKELGEAKDENERLKSLLKDSHVVSSAEIKRIKQGGK